MPMHPFIEALVERFRTLPSLSDGTPQQGRDFIAAGRAAVGAGPQMHRTLETTIPTREGTIAARLHIPVEKPAGIVVYVHGGGWALGCIDDFDTLGRTLAAKSGCAVLLPEYRLAPEHPFPAGLHDVEDAIVHISERASDLLGAPLPIVVAGDSAGANLATVAARTLRGRTGIVLQVLVYPVTDSDFGRPSYRDHAEGLPLSRKDMEWFFGLYAPPASWSDPAIAPLLAADLAGVAPALVVTAEYDVLASEGEAYADRLAAEGVEVEFRRVPGVTHGFIRLHNLFDVADRELDLIAARIAAACLGRSRAAG